jgi:predicted nuclease of predicted toxin-antitoxin system
MKFIVDAQLPKSISDFLCNNGHDCIHTLDLPKRNKTTDKEIITVSIAEQRIVITKDSDFLESFMINNQPEKLILVKTGNINNVALIEIFNQNLDIITNHLLHHSLIEINKKEIIIHA